MRSYTVIRRRKLVEKREFSARLVDLIHRKYRPVILCDFSIKVFHEYEVVSVEVRYQLTLAGPQDPLRMKPILAQMIGECRSVEQAASFATVPDSPHEIASSIGASYILARRHLFGFADQGNSVVVCYSAGKAKPIAVQDASIAAG